MVRKLIFNPRDLDMRLIEQTRVQLVPCDIELYFAPLKHARLDCMVQKAVEMGFGCLRPVMTAHTSVSWVNLKPMRANAIEEVEQCGLVTVTKIT